MVLVEWKAGWAPGLGRAFLRRENPLSPAMIKTLHHPARSLVTVPTAIMVPNIAQLVGG